MREYIRRFSVQLFHSTRAHVQLHIKLWIGIVLCTPRSSSTKFIFWFDDSVRGKEYNRCAPSKVVCIQPRICFFVLLAIFTSRATARLKNRLTPCEVVKVVKHVRREYNRVDYNPSHSRNFAEYSVEILIHFFFFFFIQRSALDLKRLRPTATIGVNWALTAQERGTKNKT